MSHLLTLLIVAFTYGAAAFPPSKLYFGSATSGRPSGAVNITAEYNIKEIPYVDWYCTSGTSRDSSNENFIAFAKTFDLDVDDWERIRYNHVDNMFYLLYRVRCYVLFTFPPPPR
ncbi:hypothetical protein FOZ61_004038 [Perkinsus olseni]|uniref:Uncharacterized protein n=1 Tax=Perkinsus olseni TaxID=32597 RepID=A0A7J6LNB8_PEROL|nr:hypothetical protein FOZ61_004038 [Perkinsus olseni]